VLPKQSQVRDQIAEIVGVGGGTGKLTSVPPKAVRAVCARSVIQGRARPALTFCSPRHPAADSLSSRKCQVDFDREDADP
jgi:hypothetical protein